MSSPLPNETMGDLRRVKKKKKVKKKNKKKGANLTKVKKVIASRPIVPYKTMGDVVSVEDNEENEKA